MRSSLSTIIPCLLLIALAFGGTARADRRERAETLNAEGKALVKQLELEEAADRFRRAMKLANDPRYAFNLCYTLEKIRVYQEAKSACEKVASAQDARLAKKARSLLTTIDQKLAEQAAKRPPAPTPQPAPATTQPPAPQPGPPSPAVRPGVPAPSGPPLPAAGPPAAHYPYAPNGAQQNLYMPQKRTVTYRTHVILADAAAWTLMLLGAAAESPELTGTGFATLIAGGPTVHFVHGNSRSGYYSLGMRLGFPLATALVFSGGCTDDYGCIGLAIGGGVVGYSAAAALDWFLLARKTEFVTPKAPPMVQPTVSFANGGMSAGLRFRL